MSRLTELIEGSIQARRERGMLVQFPQGNADQPVLPAYVNHGRWIVKCPWCAGATILVDEDRRFFCADCCNAGAGFKYVPVKVRPDRAAIDAQLMKRPNPVNRNCFPEESLDDLIQEDALHGLF